MICGTIIGKYIKMIHVILTNSLASLPYNESKFRQALCRTESTQRGGDDTQVTVYLDILYCINLFMTYLLLLSTRALAQVKVPQGRLFIAALIGALSCFSILLPPLPTFVYLACKLLFSAGLVWIAFSKHRFIKHLLFFYGSNFLYAGVIEGLLQLFEWPGAIFQNGSLYLPLSAVRLCIFSILAYLVLEVLSRLLFYTTAKQQLTTLRLDYHGRTTSMTTLLDTGNLTRDVVTGLPVVICESKMLTDIFSSALLEKALQLQWGELPLQEQKIFRLIPMKDIGGERLLVAFEPTGCALLQEGAWKPCDVIAAITTQDLAEGQFHAVAPAKLIY